MSEVLSPTPPVLCLSTVCVSAERSTVSPEYIMCFVSENVSLSLIPRKHTAMQKAEA